jgi:dihydroflavonol-4-reductase
MILVTGATGILGRIIVLELLKQQKQVRACYHTEYKLADVLFSFKQYLNNDHLAQQYFDKIQWLNTDFSDFEAIKEALEAVNEVYHCAALVSFDPQDKAVMDKINIEFTKNLLYIAQEKNIQKFCYISSIATLDKLNDEFEIDEISDWDSKTSHSDYAMSKYLAEMEVWRANAEGLNSIIINPAVIIAGGNAQSSAGLFALYQKQNYCLPGETGYVDVRDVAQTSIKLMALNLFGQRFICSAEQKTHQQIANQIRVKNKQKATRVLSKIQLKTLFILSRLFGRFSKALRQINHDNFANIYQNKNYQNKKIIAATGHQFIAIDQSIATHYQHYINYLQYQIQQK